MKRRRNPFTLRPRGYSGRGEAAQPYREFTPAVAEAVEGLDAAMLGGTLTHTELGLGVSDIATGFPHGGAHVFGGAVGEGEAEGALRRQALPLQAIHLRVAKVCR